MLNGKTRMGFTIVGALAVLASVFTAGVNYRELSGHVEDTELHESVDAKNMRIDNRVVLRLAPIKVQLTEMNKKLDRLLSE